MDIKEVEETISLHGLGFIQVKLGGKQRLHVWHPELPRRKCFAYSSIHDHRFSFSSNILVGSICNIEYKHHDAETLEDPMGENATHIAYLHKGERGPHGGRPWIEDGRLILSETSRKIVSAGDGYHQDWFVYHQTEVVSPNRKLATVIRKTREDKTRAAHSLCEPHVKPEADFNRFQWKEEHLWEVVLDVLGAGDRKSMYLDIVSR